MNTSGFDNKSVVSESDVTCRIMSKDVGKSITDKKLELVKKKLIFCCVKDGQYEHEAINMSLSNHIYEW